MKKNLIFIIILIFMFLSCSHLKTYNVIDQSLKNNSTTAALDSIFLPFELIRNKTVSINITGYSSRIEELDDLNKEFLLKEILIDKLKKENIKITTADKSDFYLECSLIINGNIESRLWIPLIYKLKKRIYSVELKISIIEKESGQIVFNKTGKGVSIFKEKFFFELIGPFKNISD